MGKQWKQWLSLFFFLAPKSLQVVIEAMKLKDAYSLAYLMTDPRLCLHPHRDSQETLVDEGPLPARGIPGGLSGKESACRFRRHGFDPWVGKIP